MICAYDTFFGRAPGRIMFIVTMGRVSPAVEYVFSAVGFGVMPVSIDVFGEVSSEERNGLYLARMEKYCVRWPWGMKVSCVLFLVLPPTISDGLWQWYSWRRYKQSAVSNFAKIMKWDLRYRSLMYLPVAVNVTSK